MVFYHRPDAIYIDQVDVFIHETRYRISEMDVIEEGYGIGKINQQIDIAFLILHAVHE